MRFGALIFPRVLMWRSGKMKGLLGQKIGMTEVYDEDGNRVPVTVLEGGPCPVLAVKTKASDGYDAVVLGFRDKSEKRSIKPELGFFKKANATPKRFIRELRMDAGETVQVGQLCDIDSFTPGDYVDVTSVSIGKGFQGGIKRWHWKGGRATRGSMHHRAPGSIGSSSSPSRVFKGHHLPGHMGNVNRTVQGLEVVSTDKENHLLLVKGAVPGKKGFVVIQLSRKKKHKVKIVQEKKEEKKEEKKKAPKKS